jgi:hypothetical protein
LACVSFSSLRGKSTRFEKPSGICGRGDRFRSRRFRVVQFSSGISNQLLEWKGIEATEQLAHAPNAKIVVIGNPKNGMPLIIPTEQK